MKTYRAVHLWTGDWAVHCYVDGQLTGIVETGFPDQVEALRAAYRLETAQIGTLKGRPPQNG